MSEIPSAADALNASTAPPRSRARPIAYQKAIMTALSAISRAVRARMTSTVVEVPTFVFGQPRFSVDDVTEYVRSCLESKGYWVVTYPGSASIAIGWSGTTGATDPATSPIDTATHETSAPNISVRRGRERARAPTHEVESMVDRDASERVFGTDPRFDIGL